MSTAARDARTGIRVSELLNAGYVIQSYQRSDGVFEVYVAKRGVDVTGIGMTLDDAIADAGQQLREAA